LPQIHPANGIFVNRSTDGGVSWLAQPYAVTENGDPEGSEGTTIRDDRPGIACDRVPNSPFVNTVYVAWTRGTAQSSDNQVCFSWHDQELLEFSSPVKISDSPTGLAQAPAVAVGAGGRVLVAWYDKNAQKILLDISTDGGRTFGVDRVVASNVADGVVVRGARAPTYPSMATDDLGGRYNGNVYVAWHEDHSGSNRVMFRRSTDNGDSWEAAFPLEEDLTSHRWFPWVTTAPNGVVHAVYYSQTPSGVFVRLAASYQGGVEGQFEHTSASDGPIVYGGSGSPPFMGDYIGVAAGLDNVYPTWCATVNQQEDVFVRRIIQPSYNVVLEQKDEAGTPLGQLRQWDGFDFGQPFGSGTTRRFRIYTEEIVRADTNLLGQNKYNDWENEPNILNHHRFEVDDSSLSTYTARLKNAHNASVITGVIDGPATGGSVWFIDPWYRDTSDVLGVVNRGLGAVSRSVLSATYNVGLASPYRGVFLGQPFGGITPYYSVAAPESQSIGVYPSYFLKWTGLSSQFQDSLHGETAVAFTQAGATATALYKAHLHSGTTSALSSNSQRKVIRDGLGGYHMVYESAGHIWHVRSSDGGTTWSREVRLSQEGSIPVTYGSPSMSVRSGTGEVAVVWQWQDASTTCVQLALLDRATGQVVSIQDLVTYGFAQSAGTMPVVGHAVYGSESYLLAAWYDASGGTVRGRVLGPDGVLAEEIELIGHAVTSLSITPHAEDEYWGVASSDGVSVTYQGFSAPDGSGESEETVATGSDDVYQRYPSLAFGRGPWNNPGVAWEEYTWEIDRRVVKYRERRAEWWGSVSVFTDNSAPPDYHAPTFSACKSSQNVGIVWRSGTHDIRYVLSEAGFWGPQTTLSTSGFDPALSVGENADAGVREVVAYRGLTSLYAISTPGILLGGEEEEKPAGVLAGAGTRGEGRGATIVFPSGSIRLAMYGVRFGDRPVAFRALEDTVEIRTVEALEKAIVSEPLTGAGILQMAVVARASGDLPPNGRIRLVLRDAESGAVKSAFRAFGSIRDSLHVVRIPLSIGTKRHVLGIQLEGIANVMAIEPERWFVQGDDSTAMLALAAGGNGQSHATPEQLPSVYRVQSSYPNPFNPSTEIRYELPEPARVSLTVYDVLGRVVETLLDETKEAGYHTVHWNAAGRSSGVYLARFTATTAGGRIALQQTMKLVLAK
jgi:hypothetical protein